MSSTNAKRSFGAGLARGLKRSCPNCGEGRLFRGYLKVEETCPKCGHENGAYRSDDGPAYITMLLVGHVVIAPLLTFPAIWETDWQIVVPLMLGGVGGVTLATLPFVKGGFIGAQWAAGRAPTQ